MLKMFWIFIYESGLEVIFLQQFIIVLFLFKFGLYSYIIEIIRASLILVILLPKNN